MVSVPTSHRDPAAIPRPFCPLPFLVRAHTAHCTLWRRLSLAVGEMGCERPHSGSCPTPMATLWDGRRMTWFALGTGAKQSSGQRPLTHTRNISRQTGGLWHTTSRNHIKTYTHPLPIIPFPSIIQLHYSNISDPSRPARLSLLRQPPEIHKNSYHISRLFLPPLRLQVLRSVQHPPHSH